MEKSRENSVFREKYGPYALVAGASYGLGGAYAEALAERGMNLILMARDKDRLMTSAARLTEQYPVDVITFAADLADYEKVKNFISGLEVSIGLLVYNAAYAPIGPFEKMSEEQLALSAAVNVRTPLLLTKLLSQKMIQNKKGGIVLMSSLAGIQGSPNLAAYAATKAFNAILAESLWNELRPHGVDVVGCCAGAVLTPGYSQAKSKTAPGALPAEIVAEQALKALGHGPITVPGNLNKFVKFLMVRILPRRAAISIMARNTGSLS